jgi:hypothetical protein
MDGGTGGQVRPMLERPRRDELRRSDPTGAISRRAPASPPSAGAPPSEARRPAFSAPRRAMPAVTCRASSAASSAAAAASLSACAAADGGAGAPWAAAGSGAGPSGGRRRLSHQRRDSQRRRKCCCRPMTHLPRQPRPDAVTGWSHIARQARGPWTLRQRPTYMKGGRFHSCVGLQSRAIFRVESGSQSRPNIRQGAHCRRLL